MWSTWFSYAAVTPWAMEMRNEGHANSELMDGAAAAA